MITASTDGELLGSGSSLGFTCLVARWGRDGHSLVGSRRRSTTTVGKPCLATSSDSPFSSTTGLVTEWSRQLDECFAHRSLMSDTIVHLGRVLAVIC
jgi:hypothetical protein